MKLKAEIRIHKQLAHNNVVRFRHVFEDKTHVYLLLDVCENRSLADLVKKRKRLSEGEVRYFLVQLV